MEIPYHISESLETIFGVKNILCDSESGIFLTMNPGTKMEKFGLGIRDKHPGSATLFLGTFIFFLKSFHKLKISFVLLFFSNSFDAFVAPISE
jgi:hypothetical protein